MDNEQSDICFKEVHSTLNHASDELLSIIDGVGNDGTESPEQLALTNPTVDSTSISAESSRVVTAVTTPHRKRRLVEETIETITDCPDGTKVVETVTKETKLDGSVVTKKVTKRYAAEVPPPLDDPSQNSDDKRDSHAEQHKKESIPVRCGKWDGKSFPPTKWPYQKYKCSKKCGRMVRTYCICDKRRILCDECFLIHYTEQCNAIRLESTNQQAPHRQHFKETLPVHCGRWDPKKGAFKHTKQAYQKSECSKKCGRRVRTYCVCDMSAILCDECFFIHYAEQCNNGSVS